MILNSTGLGAFDPEY